MTATIALTEYVPSVRDIPGVKRAPVLAEASLSGKWIPPMAVYVARHVDAEIERLTRQRDTFEHQVDLKNQGLREQRAEIERLRTQLGQSCACIPLAPRTDPYCSLCGNRIPEEPSSDNS